jgi:hypothetical protein
MSITLVENYFHHFVTHKKLQVSIYKPIITELSCIVIENENSSSVTLLYHPAKGPSPDGPLAG